MPGQLSARVGVWVVGVAGWNTMTSFAKRARHTVGS
jgi:hypothetical protein